MTLADILRAGDPTLRTALLSLLAENNVGNDLQLVTYSAEFLDSAGKEVHLTNQLFFVSRTFHLEFIYQIECYLIKTYGVQKFLKDTTLSTNVSSKSFKVKPAPK